MKFKVKTKDCQLTVRVRAWFGESLDEDELNRFQHAVPRGFLKPRQISRRSVEFTGPIGISLYERLKQPITGGDLLSILEQIVLADQKLRAASFLTSNFLTDIHNTFINEVTKEVQFIYLPAQGCREEVSMDSFLNAIIYSAKPVSSRDSEMIAGAAYTFRAMPKLDLMKLERYIEKADKSLVRMLKRQIAGQSDFITDKVQDYYAHYEHDSADDDPTGLLCDEQDDDYDDESTGLINEEYGAGCGCGNYPGYAGRYEPDEPTGLLCENSPEEPTGLLFDEDDGQNTGLLGDDDDDEGATGLLSEDDSYEQPAEEPCHMPYPYLIRLRTDEAISVNKPVFRLGKERNYVDYFVRDNVMVSRSHADIITRSGRYFVVDQNSKNHTFINNCELPIKSEVEIRDGDMLKLGNEEFVFHI